MIISGPIIKANVWSQGNFEHLYMFSFYDVLGIMGRGRCCYNCPTDMCPPIQVSPWTIVQPNKCSPGLSPYVPVSHRTTFPWEPPPPKEKKKVYPKDKCPSQHLSSNAYLSRGARANRWLTRSHTRWIIEQIKLGNRRWVLCMKYLYWFEAYLWWPNFFLTKLVNW